MNSRRNDEAHRRKKDPPQLNPSSLTEVLYGLGEEGGSGGAKYASRGSSERPWLCHLLSPVNPNKGGLCVCVWSLSKKEIKNKAGFRQVRGI